jgi:hypothetical protein
MTVAIVAGAIANKPGNGGEAWVRLSYALGLRRLGFDVLLLEQIASESCVDAAGQQCAFAESVNRAYFERVTGALGLGIRPTLVCDSGPESSGLSYEALLDVSGEAEVLLNISGHLDLAAVRVRTGVCVYVDVDPGYTQLWHATGNPGARLAGHDAYFTVGANIGTDRCLIPTCGIDWQATRPPVVLDEFPVSETLQPARFTTVASWRGAYGPIEHEGRHFGPKAHEFRRFADVPHRTTHTFEIALDIHQADDADRSRMIAAGWQIADPRDAAGTPDAFRSYVQGSGAEFSVAQSVYVGTRTGWFSDRSVRYLAAGKPVLVQDTGLAELYPVGDGLLTFENVDQAVERSDRIVRDYDAHSRAARRLAERYFDSDVVIGSMLDAVGVATTRGERCLTV